MSDKINKKAIISVADKNGIVELCRELDRLGFEMIATGGTHKLLEDNGIKAVKISDYTGGSESERVKTLSQRIAREILETGEIGLVICNLYPFFDQQGKSIDEMIEFVDIGGVTLIRAGAKNFKKVGVVYDPNQYADIVRALKEDKFNEEYRLNLVRMAFDYIAWYDTIIASYFAGEFSDRIFISNAAKLFIPMRYGENPHQKAAFFLNPIQQGGFKIHGGKQISYNNLLDAEVAISAASEFKDDIAGAIIKHQTPCGVALGSNQAEAFERAYTADSVSAFGGIVGLNRSVEPATAELIIKYFFEVIIAPGFDDRAIEILQAKKNLRLVEIAPDLLEGTNQRSVFGGILVQDKDTGRPGDWQYVTKRAPTDDETQALKFAWKVVKWTKSNSIVFAVKGRTVGIGAGQTSRVGAVEIAAQTAANQGNIVMASDAFFPFRDGIDTAAKAGVKAVIQPGGSKRDQESIDACNEHDIAMVFTGMRHFRH
ncbi:bifunctional phosphoribosylaminoimidazolecarboxamide formyltransferase/IMP cyclohydrolase [candidate division WOR-3 bacterium RBG_13_43_14]|uniref:Bifunctional purine biosynthesis protein PurH n=1 Tax=candidate division WOR-3 bacterium RBG_13_43_14 TaxID=1802590 RepID=A0A1F4UAR3_UNCW3|nr:MAG: bifunctional phosphoribosylaminoimidazolecarboxamide formyltransferase/IMP cyclohydrolase [candidate division WOR-3 bacterium RBG_13_43_14]